MNRWFFGGNDFNGFLKFKFNLREWNFKVKIFSPQKCFTVLFDFYEESCFIFVMKCDQKSGKILLLKPWKFKNNFWLKKLTLIASTQAYISRAKKPSLLITFIIQKSINPHGHEIVFDVDNCVNITSPLVLFLYFQGKAIHLSINCCTTRKT